MNLFTFQNLLKAYYSCRRHKRFSRSAGLFEFSFEKELLKLEQELQARSYKPSKYSCFAITDPKLREVWAADFRDRIVHHLLINFIEPIFEAKFIFHSYACRKNKGAHLAIYHLKKTITNKRPKFFLQIDIRSFFTSIDKNILFSLLFKHITNPDILWLTKTIIFHAPQNNYQFKGDVNLIKSIPVHKSLLQSFHDKGLPIGNLSSQFFANLYLNELDQFCKHSLKCKYYYRYMDDMVILHENKNQLAKWQNDIELFLDKNLKLRLHPKKIKLGQISGGIDFLGYIVFPDYVYLRRRSVKKLKQKLWYFNKNILEKNYSQPIRLWTPELCAEFQNIFSSVNSYYGLLKHGNCLSLRRHLYDKHFGILKVYLLPANRHYDYFIWSEPLP